MEKKVVKVICRFTRQRPLYCFTFILSAIANCRLTRLRPLVIRFFQIIHHRDSFTWRKFDLGIEGQGRGRFVWNCPVLSGLISLPHFTCWAADTCTNGTHCFAICCQSRQHTEVHKSTYLHTLLPADNTDSLIRWNHVKRSLALSKWLSYSPLFYFAILFAILKCALRMLFKI